MNDQVHVMTAAEMEILSAAVSEPNIFFDYWFRKPGQKKGWQLDYNFIEDQKWQEQMCMASQSFIVAIAGISTGKTLGIAMSAAYHAVLTPSFKFLSVAPTAKQSGLMHQALIEQFRDTPFEDFVIAKPTRPNPSIRIAYMVGDRRIESLLEFLSTGEKGDATNIMSYRGDWINIEEAGLIDNLNEIVGNLATRLTGVTADGRAFLARMSLISNPWDNIELWQLYDMALADTEDGLVFNIDTAANKNTTPKQIKLALKRIPEEQHERFMTGKRQQGRGEYFASRTVEGCESEILQEAALKAYREKQRDCILIENPVLGVWHMRMPRVKGRSYFLIGDPGTGAAPARNAPTLMVFDVTQAKDKPIFVPMVAFWWGNGGGSIMPFIDKMLEWMDYYQPLHTYVDNTGTQKNTVELINFDRFYDQDKGFLQRGIEGCSFASQQKITYLMALRLSLEGRHFAWPKFLMKSVSSQLKNYDYIKDKNPNSKLAQDCVAVLAMAAFEIRREFSFNDENDGDETEPVINQRGNPVRNNRGEGTRRDPRRGQGITFPR